MTRSILITGAGSGIGADLAAQTRERGLPEEQVIREVMLKPMPKKSFVAIAEIVAAAEYFMNDAVKSVTGRTLAIDGGWTAQ